MHLLAISFYGIKVSDQECVEKIKRFFRFVGLPWFQRRNLSQIIKAENTKNIVFNPKHLLDY